MSKFTKREARRALGAKSDYRLAQILGLTRQAVSLWPETKSIPPARQEQVRALLAERKEVPHVD